MVISYNYLYKYHVIKVILYFDQGKYDEQQLNLFNQIYHLHNILLSYYILVVILNVVHLTVHTVGLIL